MQAPHRVLVFDNPALGRFHAPEGFPVDIEEQVVERLAHGFIALAQCFVTRRGG